MVEVETLAVGFARVVPHHHVEGASNARLLRPAAKRAQAWRARAWLCVETGRVHNLARSGAPHTLFRAGVSDPARLRPSETSHGVQQMAAWREFMEAFILNAPVNAGCAQRHPPISAR